MAALIPVPFRRRPFHRVGSWLPENHKVLFNFVDGILKTVEQRKCDCEMKWTPEVESLNNLVQNDTQLRMLSSAMFDEVPNKEPYNRDPVGYKQIKSWDEMLCAFTIIQTRVAPSWNKCGYDVGLIGFPFNAILDWPMATQSGYAFFLNPEVNLKLKGILDKWSKDVLQTSKSQSVLTTDEDGWLYEEALATIEKDTNVTGKQLKFQDLFKCDPNKPHWGFESWDGFFIREFKDIDKLRPVAYPDDPNWIVSACESKPYALQADVKELDTFWLKGQPYSLLEMLDHQDYAKDFVGGTVYQAFLSATSYHRWTSPVKGKVLDAKIIPGTYFSEPTITGFTNPEGPDPAAPDQAQGYITHVATRAVFLIEAEDPVGFICVLFVGMADVSTCEIVEKFRSGSAEVDKGEELGMFHHGGSTYCILFQKDVKLAWTTKACPSTAKHNVPVRGELAYVYAKGNKQEGGEGSGVGSLSSRTVMGRIKHHVGQMNL